MPLFAVMEEGGKAPLPLQTRPCARFGNALDQAAQPKPSSGMARANTTRVITTSAATLIRAPARTISATLSLPLAKTTALGGVATGSMKAQRGGGGGGAESSSGLAPRLTVSEAVSGRIAAAVAEIGRAHV